MSKVTNQNSASKNRPQRQPTAAIASAKTVPRQSGAATQAATVPTLDRLAKDQDALGQTDNTWDGPRNKTDAGKATASTTSFIEAKLKETYISDGDEAEILDALRDVGPQGFKQVMEALGPKQQNKLFRRFGADAGSLVSLAEKSGWLDRVPSPDTAAVQNKAFSPPASPAFVKNASRFPPAIKEAIHEENLGRAQAYEKSYGEYQERWTEAVQAAEPDLARIRKLGPASPALVPNAEPGLEPNDKKAAGYSHDWFAGGLRTGLDWQLRSQRVITHVVARHQGRAVGGALEFNASITASLSTDDAQIGGKVEIKREDDGKTTRSLESSASVGGQGVKMGDDGKVKPSISAQSPGPRGTRVGLPVASVSVGAHEVAAKIGLVGASMNDKGQVGVSLGKTFTINRGPVKAEIGAEIGAKFKPGIDRERIGYAFDQNLPGFYETPTELSQNKSWDDVSSERRRALHDTSGWTKQEWEAARQLQHANLRPYLR